MLAQIVLISLVIALIMVLHNKLVGMKEIVERFYTVDELYLGDAIHESAIPKTIWTFWYDCPSQVQLSFIKSWLIHNPDYKIIALTPTNYTKYIKQIPGLDKLDGKRRRNVIAMAVVSELGGIYMDSCMLCSRSLSWIHTVQERTGVDFIGYYVPDATFDEKYPAIEDWFFACTPNCMMLQDWTKELLNAYSFEGINSYISYAKERGVVIKAEAAVSEVDLMSHSALQFVLQTASESDTYKVKVFDCFSGPYYYLKAKNKSIIPDSDVLQPLIKLREKEYNTLVASPKLLSNMLQKFKVENDALLSSDYSCGISNGTEIVLSLQ